MTVSRMPTRAQLAAQLADLEKTLEVVIVRNRSLSVQLERAEADRDRALMRLASCADENGRRRHLLMQARSAIGDLERRLDAAQNGGT